jgi:hypothetical protein
MSRERPVLELKTRPRFCPACDSLSIERASMLKIMTFHMKSKVIIAIVFFVVCVLYFCIFHEPPIKAPRHLG